MSTRSVERNDAIAGLSLAQVRFSDFCHKVHGDLAGNVHRHGKSNPATLADGNAPHEFTFDRLDLDLVDKRACVRHSFVPLTAQWAVSAPQLTRRFKQPETEYFRNITVNQEFTNGARG